MFLRFAIAALAAGAALVSLAVCACGGPEFVLASDDAAAPSSDGAAIGADARTDASADAGASSGPFCTLEAGYDFCADFDEQPLSVEWNDFYEIGGATAVDDDGASVSPPNSLLATSPPLSAVDAGARAVVSEISLPKGQTHITFDLRIDELSFPGGSDPTALVIVAAYTQGMNYGIALAFRPTPGGASPFSASLVESSTALTSSTPTVKFTALSDELSMVGLWYHVAIDFNIDTATDPTAVPASFAFTAGSPPTTSTKLVTLSPPLGTALGSRTLSVGVESTAAVGEAKIRFDNVTYKH